MSYKRYFVPVLLVFMVILVLIYSYFIFKNDYWSKGTAESSSPFGTKLEEIVPRNTTSDTLVSEKNWETDYKFLGLTGRIVNFDGAEVTLEVNQITKRQGNGNVEVIEKIENEVEPAMIAKVIESGNFLNGVCSSPDCGEVTGNCKVFMTTYIDE